jgi:hypothetical protein
MEITPDFGNHCVEASLPPFPDYDLDWPDVMTNIDNFLVPDHIQGFDAPRRSVLAGEIYQERIVYCVKRMKEYPETYIRERSTPFIHARLYTANVPQAIHDVLGACALYAQKTERNQSLVFGTIGQNATQLTEKYSPMGLSAMDQLASVQAMVLYQIIRLFDGDIRQRADAERADATLRLWTNQLKLRAQWPKDPLGSRDDASELVSVNDPWRSWIFAESLRRTLIVSFSVQGLYSFLKNGSDDSHHDFEDMSFYAQRALWEAPSEHYWRVALKEKPTLPLAFPDWDRGIADAKPSDIENIGMMMMVLIKGVDYCQEWAGEQEQNRFGLAMHGYTG